MSARDRRICIVLGAALTLLGVVDALGQIRHTDPSRAVEAIGGGLALVGLGFLLLARRQSKR